MKAYILLCGLLRSFDETLLPFLDQLSKQLDCKFIINVPKQKQKEDKFTYNEQNTQIEKLSKHPNSFICIQHDPELDIENLSKREQSYIIQWYRLWICSQILETIPINNSDIVIRIRPDIKLNCDLHTFINNIQDCYDQQTLWINTHEIDTYKNTFAMGPLKYMKQFCSFYTSLQYSLLMPLSKYLQEQNIPIYNFKLDSTICLSKCKIIAITGDSGVGKSTLATAIQKFFPYDSNLLLETDRYHKWERKSEEWSKTTHLNPEANYLEKLADDTFLLKLGEQIEHVDYDHSTGTFTAPEQIESKNYIFLCGLHTLYQNIRMNTDINIFIDCQYELKRFWKCRRDMKKRGYSLEQALLIFEKRHQDYIQYILPQKEHADICIEYYTNDILTLKNQLEKEPTLQSKLKIKSNLLLQEIIQLFNVSNAQTTIDSIYTEVNFPTKIDIQSVLCKLPDSIVAKIHIEDIEAGILGVVQILLVLLCV